MIDIYNPLHYNTRKSYCIDSIFRLIAFLFRIRLPKSERAAAAGNTYDLRIDLLSIIMYDQSVRYFLPAGSFSAAARRMGTIQTEGVTKK